MERTAAWVKIAASGTAAGTCRRVATIRSASITLARSIPWGQRAGQGAAAGADLALEADGEVLAALAPDLFGQRQRDGGGGAGHGAASAGFPFGRVAGGGH